MVPYFHPQALDFNCLDPCLDPNLVLVCHCHVTCHWSVRCCILIISSHGRRCWNTIYMYEVNLLWVWSGWSVSIITYTLYPYHIPSETPTDNWITHHLCDCETKHLSGWGCILMTSSHGRRCWNIIYIYEVDLPWVGTGCGASIIRTTTPAHSPTASCQCSTSHCQCRY
jgi:hypothetical protein